MERITEQMGNAPHVAKIIADTGAVSVGIGSFFTDVIPVVASLLSIVWLSLQIFTWVAKKKWK